MKTINKFRLVIAALIVLSTSSCLKDDFDAPDMIEPVYNGPAASISIADLKAKVPASGVLQIEPQNNGVPTVIEGVVTGNDVSGNIYKTLYIQDNNGAALTISIDKTNMYNTYRVGQRLFVKCDDLYLGQYGGSPQLGYLYEGGIGRIPATYVDAHFFVDGYVDKNQTPAPKAITSASALTDADKSLLVTLVNVSFVDANGSIPYSDPTPVGSNPISTNRTLKFADGSTIYVRTSSAANFSSLPMPIGTGNLTGIMSKFNNDWQLYIRDITDVNFAPSTATTVAISSSPITAATVNMQYEYSIQTTVLNPSGATTITATGLPAGLQFIDNGDGTATISGMPTATGSSNIVITATNNGVNGTQSFTLTVNNPVTEVSIASVRAMYTGTDISLTGNSNKIVGVVISDRAGGNSTSLANFTIAAVDNSTGIMIRVAAASHTYNLNDKVDILLNNTLLSAYGGAVQLNNVPLANIQKVGTATITPRVTTIADINANYVTSSYESTVVTITGTVTSSNGNWGSSTVNQTDVITKDANTMDAFVARYATFVNTALPAGEATLTGVMGQFNGVYQFNLRNLSDITQ